MNKTILIAFFSLITLGLSSCEEDDTKILPTDILSFWEFKGYEINGTLEKIPDTVSIDLYIGSIYSRGNDFEGASPLRNYWGRFRLDGNKIDFYDLRVTDVPIENDSALFYSTEKRYLNSLMRSTQYEVENNTLTIAFGSDSLLVFTKSSNTIYQDNYEFSALYDGIEWMTDSNKSRAVGNSFLSFTLHGVPVLKYSDGNLYELSIWVYYPPKAGLYIENENSAIRAISSIKGNANFNRSESTSGYVKVNRISRKFISGEFGFQMASDGSQLPEEFEITRGKFKLPFSVYNLYIPY